MPGLWCVLGKNVQTHRQCDWNQKIDETQVNIVWWREGTLTIRNIVGSNTAPASRGWDSTRASICWSRIYSHCQVEPALWSGVWKRGHINRHTQTLSMFEYESHTQSKHILSVYTHTDGRQRVCAEMQTLGCRSQCVPKAMILCQSCLDWDKKWYSIPPEMDIIQSSHLTMRINLSLPFLFESFHICVFLRSISLREHCDLKWLLSIKVMSYFSLG